MVTYNRQRKVGDARLETPEGVRDIGVPFTDGRIARRDQFQVAQGENDHSRKNVTAVVVTSGSLLQRAEPVARLAKCDVETADPSAISRLPHEAAE